MKTILVCERNLEVRELLVHVIAAMGCEAVLSEPPAGDVDLLLIEPGDGDALELAGRLRAAHPELPIVCVSIYPPQLESDLLSPLAYLLKPFSVAELQGVLRNALAARTVAVGAASAPLSHQTQ